MTLLVAADLLSPDGEIDGVLFYPSSGSSAITSRLDAYLTQGYTRATAAEITDATTSDDFARAFAYWRAWSDVVQRITLAPASTSLAGDISVTRLQSQIAEWVSRRDYWEQQFLALLPDPNRTAATRGVTQSIPNSYRF